MTKKAEFRLFSNCILVRGVKRSTICDLQRNEVHFVPNGFVETYENEVIYADTQLNGEMEACIEYLSKNDLGHFILDNDCFPNLDLDYDFPGTATHAILEISKHSQFHYAQVFATLSDIGVKFIELRIDWQIEPDVLCSIFESLKSTRVINVNLFMRFSEYWTNSKISELFITYQRLFSITLFSSFKDSIDNVYGRKIAHAQKELNSRECGKIHTNYFSCNIRTFSESQRMNTCLNGKISITSDGLIKNCPSLNETFGRINSPEVRELIDSEPFQKLWKVSKDKIEVCRHCEFRHVCTDCRAFLEEPDNLYSKPLKCGYDPFSCVWEDWSTNPLKQNAIEYYFGTDHLPSP